MLKLAGVPVHPGVRIAIGAIILAIGFARNTTGALIVGGALVVWGVVAVLGLAVGDGGERSGRGRSR